MDQNLRKIHKQLGIPPDYERNTGLSIQETPTDLVSIGKDMYGRQQQLRAAAAAAWREMQRTARAEQVDILLVSAFRSIEYQVEVISRLLAKGEKIKDILTRVAAPGFSEHQSGSAVDVASSDSQALEEEFDRSLAFAWLTANAARHSFFLSYPKDNKLGVIYEPWHWCYRDST